MTRTHGCLLALLLLPHSACLDFRESRMSEGGAASSDAATTLEADTDSGTGTVDPCTDEQQGEPCYGGPEGTKNVGLCRSGSRACEGGTWTDSCVGEVNPAEEVCDGLDNDCDGEVDESCPCVAGETQSCGLNTGACSKGTQSCNESNAWGLCVGEVPPTTELCDGKDNDCDGSVDENLLRSCYPGPEGTEGVGLCKGGTQTCTNGQWAACEGAVTPTNETCDDQDNDCDGTVDEALTQMCYSGPEDTARVGQCKAGTRACVGGVWGSCLGEQGPTTEFCDGFDNDCDGTVDEGCKCVAAETQWCGNEVGECTQGTQTCSLAGSWGECVGSTAAQPEACDNKDNDCDGEVDNDVVRSCYTGPDGTEDVGACRSGIETCTEGNWGGCSGQVTPKAELCDGTDTDCNGAVDDLSLTYYRDRDNDGHGDPKDKKTAGCTAPKGYVTDDTDCNDDDGRVHPGQTSYFEEKLPDKSWDYDCNGTDEPKYTTRIDCTDLSTATCLGSAGWYKKDVKSVPACGGKAKPFTTCVLDNSKCENQKSDVVQPCR